MTHHPDKCLWFYAEESGSWHSVCPLGDMPERPDVCPGCELETYAGKDPAEVTTTQTKRNQIMDEEELDAALEECGITEDGYCMLAGTEYCDFSCPFRDE